MNPRNKKYDVFLSFRGEDTRDNFTSHLYSALCEKSIETFIDNDLKRGDEISQSLLDAIEASSISVIIFSEAYASSRWCLDELLKILDCKNNAYYAQIVIPVFFRVDPSHVRKQIGIFGDFFSKLRFQVGSERMRSWRNALTEAANLSGFDSHVTRPESKLIEEIANEVLERLDDTFQRENKDLVGVESRIKQIESLLGTVSTGVCKLGIWGIGGIGKTTIAGAIFNKLSRHFKGCYFARNIRQAEESGGLAHLRQELLSTLLKDGNVKNIPNIGINFQSKRLTRKKVLIVFDDVNHPGQIEFLIGRLDWFSSGSRIIITTRDKQVLTNCGVDNIYQMKELVHGDALKLFCRCAFGGDRPYESHRELTYKTIEYALGVPLVLKVLGRFLCGRRKEVWENAIMKLEIVPHMEIQEVLKISYDGLDDKEQNIFLDIACFFVGEDRDIVTKFLDSCDFFATSGVDVLVDKSLITISDCNKISMHDLLRDMGREIIRQESINHPGNRSRLWHHNDIYEVLTKNKGTEVIEGICLDMSKVKEIDLNPNTFTKMRKLRFLKFYSSIYGENKCMVSDFQGPVFAEVRYLYWHGYPLKSLPLNIHPEKLVLLEMPHSNIQQFWDGGQHHGKLKQIAFAVCNIFTKTPNPLLIQHLNKLVILNLSGCSKLKSFPDISSAGNIEKILLKGTAVEQLPSSIDCLSRLFCLDLEDCKRLDSLPNSLFKLKSLKVLNLNSCSNLQRLPDELGNLEASESLYDEGTAIREVPSSIVPSNVHFVSFKESRGDKQMGLPLPITLSLNGLHSTLTYLYLTDCGITQLPESLGQLSVLEELYLEKNNFERIPESIIHLSKLSYLYLSYCERLQFLPKLPCKVRELDAHHCITLESLSGLFSSYGSYNQDFDLRDNFKLDQNEIRGILEDAMQEIQFMATAHWKEVREEIYCYPAQKGYVLLPGNEIPSWFSFQSMGSSLTWKMPPGCSGNKKVLGFAFSAIVAFQDHHKRKRLFSFLCEFQVKPKDCDPHVIKRHFGVIDYVESDHLLFGYYFFDDEDFKSFWEYNSVPEAVHFYFTDRNDSECLECCPVKKCGIHLLYAPDFMESMEDPTGSFNLEILSSLEDIHRNWYFSVN